MSGRDGTETRGADGGWSAREAPGGTGPAAAC